MCISSVQAADDAYLEQLDQEVSKVGGVTTDTETDGAALIAVGGGETAQAASSRQAFEVLLREEHVGTYSFYRRLPERIREEIFLDYRNGASLEALREKIVDRYLHP